jgi:competence ComEA-like helix-hairpin-helix protein
MSVPRTGSTGLKPARPGTSQSTRSTQRIVLPTPPGARTGSAKSATTSGPGGRISLPVGMILRCLPPEVLSSDLSEFEKNGTAATEIGLPMNSILGQLPSGKVEMTVQELIPHFPPGFLQPTEAITSYLPNIVSLPLMDVVMRIPPDLLALRPDQKDVDSSVINMADPFTEEILREQAETARRQSGANIIDESQAPQEEFVPRDRANNAVKSIAPPRRPTVEPLIPSRAAATTLAAAPVPPLKPPTSALPRVNPIFPPSAPVTPPPPPLASTPSPAVTSSETPAFPVPTRVTTSLPRLPGTIPTPAETPAPAAATVSSAPVPPVPRHTGPIPAPPPPRHTTSLPTVPRRSGSLASLSQRVGAKAETPVPPPGESTAPDASADDLQRLAALAMAQLGDETPVAPAETSPPPEPEPVAAAPEKKEEPTPEVAPKPSLEAEFVPTIALAAATVAGASFVAERTAPEPIRAPAPEVTEAPAPTPVPAAPAPVDAAASASVAFNVNTCSSDDLVRNVPGCSKQLAEAIVTHRDKIGSFKKLEELLDVPGMTKQLYTDLTGEAPPAKDPTMSLNELLGFPAEQNLSLKDVTDRIACWPDVTGCLLSQSTGLSLVGTAPLGLDKEAVVAFAPRMFDSLNKSFSELAGHETDALVIPTVGTSFHLFRNGDLYLIIMSRLPQMPDRHVKVARYALAALATRPN